MQTTRRMRSAAISLGLVGTLALSLSGCGTGQDAQRRCVDASSFTVVDEQNCLVATPGTTGSTSHPYRYYYGGRVSSGRVTGGSFTVPSTSHSSTSGKTSSAKSGSGSSSSSKSGVRTGGFGKSATGKSGSS